MNMDSNSFPFPRFFGVFGVFRGLSSDYFSFSKTGFN